MRRQKYKFESNPSVMRKVDWITKGQDWNECIACNWCMGGKGCNKRARRKKQPNRSWKEYRKTQWK